MLLNYNKSVAYICSGCSDISLANIQIFNFSGKGEHVLTCGDCSEKCVTITKKKDKYQINVKCPICECVHSYSIKASTFWSIDFICFKCPESDISIYFQGTHDNVIKALDEQEDFLTVKADEEQELLNDKLIIDRMIQYLRFLAELNRVLCTCGSSDIDVHVDNKSITLCCRCCGESKTFYCDGQSLMDFMSSNVIILGADTD